MMGRIKFFYHPYFLAGFLVLVVAAITAQNLWLDTVVSNTNSAQFTHCNNFVIFRQSFFHLIHQQDLYCEFLDEYWDYYKYSPTFAIIMAPVAVLPTWLGLFVWNLLSAIALFWSIWKMPFLANRKRLALLGFVLIELVTAMQHSQVNALMAALIISAFLCMERRQMSFAALLILLSAFIKLFGIVALLLFLLYPHKLKSGLYVVVWAVVLFLLPLLAVPFSQLAFLYKSWLHLLQNDHGSSYGLSLAGWLYTWFHLEVKSLTLLLGAVLLVLPLLKWNCFKQFQFRSLFLASILIWVVIFNHKAESPTYIIAVAGVGIWYFMQNKNWFNFGLLCLCFVFTILSPTDAIPRALRLEIMEPYAIKAVPCILIWFKLLWDILSYPSDYSTHENPETIHIH